jgi:selenium metabolism protein YedF
MQKANVLMVSNQVLGHGDNELGNILVKSFFHVLTENKDLPAKIIFINSGVKLVVENSPVLEDLKALANNGVKILACGTCLGHFELKDEIAVGKISNMYEIVENLMGENVVNV